MFDAKWNSSGDRVILCFANDFAVVFNVKNGLRREEAWDSVYAAWWRGKDICWAEAVSLNTFEPKDRQRVHVGSDKFLAPPGVIITAASDDGHRFLVRLAESRLPYVPDHRFKVVQFDTKYREVIWRSSELTSEPFSTPELFFTDRLIWNRVANRGAVTYAGDNEGGTTSSGFDTVAADGSSADIYSYELDGVDKNRLLAPACTPSWLHDEVVALFRRIRTQEPLTHTKTLMFLNPATKRGYLVREDPNLLFGVGSADGTRLAVAMKVAGGYLLEVFRL
ncbi:MAG: hypothetical protein H0W86_06380 [Armatimonadetes bacterium]|nr:hypothetical protein [Armatimonadota bacterium]